LSDFHASFFRPYERASLPPYFTRCPLSQRSVYKFKLWFIFSHQNNWNSISLVSCPPFCVRLSFFFFLFLLLSGGARTIPPLPARSPLFVLEFLHTGMLMVLWLLHVFRLSLRRLLPHPDFLRFLSKITTAFLFDVSILPPPTYVFFSFPLYFSFFPTDLTPW